MTAPTIPLQRQEARCPHCKDLVWGLLSGCDKPACITAEIAEAARHDRLEDRDDDH